MRTETEAGTICRCGQVIAVTGRPAADELIVITCGSCGARHYAGVGYDDGLVRVVTVDGVPETYTNIHAGDITCRDHAGGYLRASLDAHPRRKNHETPFGTYRRTEEADVAGFLVEGLTYGCETCRYGR